MLYHNPSAMEPLFPSGAPDLEDLAREVVSRSAVLGGQLHPATQQTVVELLRLINSYYSNLIEGHSTHPMDIERAMDQDYSDDPGRRDLQLESLAHIICQREIESHLQQNPSINIADSSFLCWLHRIFYEQLPPQLRQVKDPVSGEGLEVVPGELRQREVQVARHVGVASEHLASFLDRFSTAFASESHHGVMPIIAAAASHHRLMWIHPFLDGNGRVARLYTDACFHRLPLRGYGLWNISRGFARYRDDYMAALSQADAQRRNDYDGRGNLSNENLVKFCHFFLSTCLDQIDFMGNLLELDGFLDRINGYVAMRGAKLIPAPDPKFSTLKPEASFMLQEVFLRGEVGRGDLVRASGMAERTGRILLSQLLAERLLLSDTPKGVIRMGLPTHVAGSLFPELYPVQVT